MLNGRGRGIVSRVRVRVSRVRACIENKKISQIYTFSSPAMRIQKNCCKNQSSVGCKFINELENICFFPLINKRSLSLGQLIKEKSITAGEIACTQFTTKTNLFVPVGFLTFFEAWQTCEKFLPGSIAADFQVN